MFETGHRSSRYLRNSPDQPPHPAPEPPTPPPTAAGAPRRSPVRRHRRWCLTSHRVDRSGTQVRTSGGQMQRKNTHSNASGAHPQPSSVCPRTSGSQSGSSSLHPDLRAARVPTQLPLSHDIAGHNVRNGFPSDSRECTLPERNTEKISGHVMRMGLPRLFRHVRPRPWTTGRDGH